MVDEYHPDEPPSQWDGPQERVDDSELETVGHAEQPPYVHDIPTDDLASRSDLVTEARRLVGDEQVNDVLDIAAHRDAGWW
jgi:hypothetical protein